jgi:asparagine N-glycosylation enzyme membrane subunit Stt3
MALLALREMATCSAPPDLVLANLTRHTGLLWALAALVFSVTYGISIFVWSGWVQYFLVFTIFAGLSLFLSRLLTDDHEAGRHDPKLARLGLTLAGYEPDDSGAWAGEHVIVFRGLAMAVVASYALKAAAGLTDDLPATTGNGSGQTA